ncbi:TonB-dependent receptor [Gilvimarinus sp. SDUM040013]|uniref:TonB-dependent receptor n=1 Tax=Gilvimarinus gilvus TaxID=3058038 RepID=A0ABU4S4G0_9GAMM|nr:TonB-dependent receptor [Gilvimarinus sp. SDUM040013]MDO3384507.1 TonB-dependent receptor [Gilvimarinus sp. SDUM040013]MDX6850748.1 TonB-dependent receptor [Gilvimarinus sp. SDUM040013]
MQYKNKRINSTSRQNGFKKTALAATLAAVSCAHLTYAQESAGSANSEMLEEVIVKGARATIQTTIDIKRNSTTIVDGMSANDIGDMPALSIGEALESITGASSHRENGGATEISIRGLGPYLSATTFNGRNASNGSGDRSVNFSQFPSELINKLAIYKTQDASLIEGGVAGLIALETVKPLEFGKPRLQVEAKAGYQPNQQNITDSMSGDVGFRGSASYVDQFEFDNGMALGISLGYEQSDIAQPESEMRASSPSGSSLFACINDPTVTNRGYYQPSAGDCEDPTDGPSNSGDYNTEINPDTGEAYDAGKDYAFAPSSNSYRQNDTSDEREAFFAAVQFQPNDKTDINIDYQTSERIQAEKRHDLNFANQKRTTPGVTPENLVVSDTGAITNWVGETAIESNSELYRRDEDYTGYGVNVAYALTDELTISADYSFSETTRIENQMLLRTQSDNRNVFAEEVSQYRPLVQWDRDSGIRQYQITGFDITDHTLFSDRYRARIDSDVDRTNTIEAFRADFDWRLDGAITAIKGGVRFSELEYLDMGPTVRNEFEVTIGEHEFLSQVNQTCAIEFPESDFMATERDGALFTILDDQGNIAKEVNSWATFDTACAVSMLAEHTDNSTDFPEMPESKAGTTDVTETTNAAYIMADFDSDFMSKTIRGNFGLRVVQTDVTSIGYRTPYTIATSDNDILSLVPVEGADLERVEAGGDYTEVLPSINLIVDLREDLMLRGAIYRGLSRPEPADMSYQRGFTVSSEEDITELDELIQNVSGDGNPNLQPLTSWSFDTAIEWYPNQDTMLAFGLYHKEFQGGFETTRTTEEFLIDGQVVPADFDLTKTNEDASSLTGFEVTATHNFSYLPGFLSGFGFKASYNYADSDFEFEDSNYGDLTVRDDEGNVVYETDGIVEPGNVPGFSDHVFSGQLYYSVGEFDASLIYKYRSEYFQPYTSNGTRLRFVGDTGVWETRLSYYITDNVRLSLEGINLFDEPKRQYHYTRDNLGEVNSYGPRVFFGVKAKFL